MQSLIDYLDKYAGCRFVIVGKGPTSFNFDRLADVGDPIIFINDAIQFSRLAERSREKFFFALDASQSVWLKDLDATAVLATEPDAQYAVEHADLLPDRLFTSRLPESELPPRLVGWQYGHLRDGLASMTREELARANQLTIGLKGTIAPAIHFAWLCGAREIAFIGCDGAAAGYDPRIEVRSNAPDLGVHAAIRRNQDWLCEQLRLETHYVHSDHLEPAIPRRMNFAWFGSDVPQWVVDNIALFREHHPNWYIRLWRSLPDTALARAARDCSQWCQWADLLYLHVLYDEGGFVMDTDSVTVRSFEPLRQHWAFTTRHIDKGTSRLTNGVMGAVPRSFAFERALGAAAELAANAPDGGHARCTFGPTLLTELFGRGDGPMTILPHWYFYPFRTRERDLAVRFWHADRAEREELLADVLQQTGGEWPYAVHLWGVDDSSHTPAIPADVVV